MAQVDSFAYAIPPKTAQAIETITEAVTGIASEPHGADSTNGGGTGEPILGMVGSRLDVNDATYVDPDDGTVDSSVEKFFPGYPGSQGFRHEKSDIDEPPI